MSAVQLPLIHHVYAPANACFPHLQDILIRRPSWSAARQRPGPVMLRLFCQRAYYGDENVKGSAKKMGEDEGVRGMACLLAGRDLRIFDAASLMTPPENSI